MTHSKAVAAALTFFALAATAEAKPPTVTSFFPGGSRQGTTVLMTASGSFDHWPINVWCDDPGVSVVSSAEKGKLWVTVAETVPAGIHWVRLFDESGASAIRPFMVGVLPEVNEVEPNDDPARGQLIDNAAVTVNGKLARNGDVDGFVLNLRAGETLVASMEANRRLGSPMDGLLQVARTDGIVVAENDDDHDRDPQVVYKATADGAYVVRTFAFPATPDSRIGFSGGDAYVYRLTLTTRGFVDHAYPLAMTRGKSGEVRAEGWNLDGGDASLQVDPESNRVWGPHIGNVSELRRVDHATAVETEPNPIDKPQEITPPVSLTGRLDTGEDADAFQFSAKKGDALSIRVASRALGQPLDPTLRVLDAAGKLVSEADDSNNSRDAEIAFTAPSDGAFRAVVRDLNRQGGPRAVYLLTVAAPTPEVRLKLAAERFALVPGKPLNVAVTIDRTNGFALPLELSVVGLPEQITIEPATSEPKGATAKAVTLKLTAKVEAAGWSGPIRVLGRAKGELLPSTTAEAKVDGLDATTRQVWLTLGKTAEVNAPAAKPRK